MKWLVVRELGGFNPMWHFLIEDWQRLLAANPLTKDPNWMWSVYKRTAAQFDDEAAAVAALLVIEDYVTTKLLVVREDQQP